MQLPSTDRFHCLLIVQCTCTTFYSISCHLQRNCSLDAYTCLDSRSNIDDKWHKTKIVGSKKKATKIPRTNWVMEGIIFQKRMIGMLISWKKKKNSVMMDLSYQPIVKIRWLQIYLKMHGLKNSSSSIAELSITKTQQIKACLVDHFKHIFEYFK